MPLPKEVDPKDCKNMIRNLNRTDSVEMDQQTFNGSFTYSDILHFQGLLEKEEVHLTVTKLNTVLTGVFTYQPDNFIWVTDH